MTTTDTQIDPNADPEVTSSVPNFLLDEEDDSITQIMPGTVRQPENSAEPERKTAESVGIGADGTSESATIGADSQTEAADYNAILAGDMDDFDDEEPPKPTPKAPGAPTGKEWKERVAAGEAKGYEHPNKGKNPDSPTKKKRKEGSTYRRKRLTKRDVSVLAVLLIHEFMTTKMVSVLRDISVPSARRLMLGLQELGVVGQERYDYGPQLWYLTGKGKTFLEETISIPETVRPLHRKGHFDQSKIRPNLLAAHVTVLLMTGRDEIRQFADIKIGAGMKLLRQIISESYIRSEFTKVFQQWSGRGGSPEARRKAIRGHWSDLLRSYQKNSITDLLQKHPEMWMVTGDSGSAYGGKVKLFHPADLVLDLYPFGSEALFIEIETSPKDEKELKKIIRSYFDSNSPRPRGTVVYLTNQKSIAERVIRIANEVFIEMQKEAGNHEAIGKTEQSLIRVGLLRDADGKLFSGNIWDL